MQTNETIKAMLKETRENVEKCKSIPTTHRYFILGAIGEVEELRNGRADDLKLQGNILRKLFYILLQKILHDEKRDEKLIQKIMGEIKKSGAITPDAQRTRIAKAVAWPLAALGVAVCVFLSILALTGHGERAAGLGGRIMDVVPRTPAPVETTQQ